MGIAIFESASREVNDNPNRLNSNDTEFINKIFINNGFAPIESQAQMIKDKTMKAKTYESPIMIKRSDVRLEKDGMDPSLFYITFKYSSLKPFDCRIYLNATEDFSSPSSLYTQSDAFADQKIAIMDVSNGQNQTFIEKDARIDMAHFQENKVFDKLYYDIVIECTVYNKDKKKESIDCVLVTYCKIAKMNESYQLRSDIQKLKVRNAWFDMHDVYGLEDNTNSNNECEACYSNKKNTIFLPCMHSYACNDCSVFVRLRGNKCPLCREKISDTLLLEDSKCKEPSI